MNKQPLSYQQKNAVNAVRRARQDEPLAPAPENNADSTYEKRPYLSYYFHATAHKFVCDGPGNTVTELSKCIHCMQTVAEVCRGQHTCTCPRASDEYIKRTLGNFNACIFENKFFTDKTYSSAVPISTHLFLKDPKNEPGDNLCINCNQTMASLIQMECPGASEGKSTAQRIAELMARP